MRRWQPEALFNHPVCATLIGVWHTGLFLRSSAAHGPTRSGDWRHHVTMVTNSPEHAPRSIPSLSSVFVPVHHPLMIRSELVPDPGLLFLGPISTKRRENSRGSSALGK